MDAPIESWEQLGATVFIAKLSKKVGRVLSVLPRGRPKKQSLNK